MASTTRTRTAAKLAAFALALAAAVGGGALVGAAAGPIDVGGDPAHEQDGPHRDGDGTTTETTHGPADGGAGGIHDEHPGWSH